jgi:hypothetical protein
MRFWLVLCLASCATDVDPELDLEDISAEDGKADGTGWSREGVASNAELWEGGGTDFGAGTSIAIRPNGQPIIAFYDARINCRSGGFGLGVPDNLVVARFDTKWTTTVEACGNNTGKWPRIRVDATDRAHVEFSSGGTDFYTRKGPANQREEWRYFGGGSTQSGALALDGTNPLLFINGKLIANNVSTTIFDTPPYTSSTTFAFLERAPSGKLHFIGRPSLQMDHQIRYATLENGVVSAHEFPRTNANAIPLGMVLDSSGNPHVLSYVRISKTQFELWHSTRTASGWTEELIANDLLEPYAAIAIRANDELLVVTQGKLFRRGTAWTSSAVKVLENSGSYKVRALSAIVAPDGKLHVAFQLVGPKFKYNDWAPAPVYHATFAGT